MDALAFVASLVSSLAWPVAAVVLLLAFRGPIGRMVERLPKRVKAGPIEVEWPEVATEARVALATSPQVVATLPAGSLTTRLAGMAEKEPAAAIMTAWAEVERALRDRMIRANVPEERASGYMLLDYALTVGAINKSMADAIRGLMVLRNLASHGRSDEVDREKALDYLTLADAVLYTLQTVPVVATPTK